MTNRIIFVNTHPIPYFSSLYRKLNKNSNINLKVLYCLKYGIGSHFDKEFNKKINSSEKILKGFNYYFLKNLFNSKSKVNGLDTALNYDILFFLIKEPRSKIICHGWSNLTLIFILVFGRLLGHDVYLRAETPLSHEKSYSSFKSFLRKMLFKYFLFNFPTGFLYIGNQNKLFYKLYGVSDEKLFFAPYSVDNNEISQNKISEVLKEKLNGQINYKDNNRIILFCGKLSNKKAPLDLLHSFNKIANKDGLSLVFIGDGPLKTSLLESIEILGLNERVFCTGYLDLKSIYYLYKLCTIFVLPSGFGETWGLVINEVMTFGKPILVSNLVGSSSDLVSNKNGFIHEFGNIEDLTEKLEILLNKDKLWNINCKEESTLKLEKYSHNTIMECLLSL
jgi:glycosyltransferase involved in cell wall biosynthesis